MSGGGDWSDSLFKDEKGDSLGDGTWGRPEEPALTPVAWDKLPEAPDPSKKKVRARLATPAPGSQKESGLLDIKALAPSLSAGMRDEADAASPNAPAAKRNQPTPPPTARLATAAKGSAGSGLIDVGELVRMQEQGEQANAADKPKDPVAEAAIEAMNSSSSMNRGSLSSGAHSPVTPPQASDTDFDDDLDTPRGSSKLVLVIAVLAVAFVGLTAYVLSTG